MIGAIKEWLKDLVFEDIVIEYTLDKLDALELELVALKKKAIEDSFYSYDDLIRELDIVSNKIGLLADECTSREVLDKCDKLYTLSTVIWNTLRNQDNAREDILVELDELDNTEKYMYMGTPITLRYVTKVKDILNKVYASLKLGALEHESDITMFFSNPGSANEIRGKYSYGGITYRQIHSFEHCLECTTLGNIPKAVHALYEFIENYNYNRNEPFTSFERVAIKAMINNMVTVLDALEEHKDNKSNKDNSENKE